MWSLGLRDLRWRRRRFAIAVLSTAVVLALTLLLSGLSASFRNEARRTVDAFGAEAWVVPRGVSGPFTATSAFPQTTSDTIARTPGVDRSGAVVLLRGTIERKSTVDVNLVGFQPGRLGVPPISKGRLPRTAGEVAPNERLGLEIGATVRLAGRQYRTVGETSGLSYYGGISTIYMTLPDAQALAYRGQRLMTAVVLRGTPQGLPNQTKLMTNGQVRADLLRPLKNATRTIDLIQVLLWIVAALIVGSIMYVSTLERLKDFAVLKATGFTNRSLLAGLGLQAVVLAILAALVAWLFAALLGPQFPCAWRSPHAPMSSSRHWP